MHLLKAALIALAIQFVSGPAFGVGPSCASLFDLSPWSVGEQPADFIRTVLAMPLSEIPQVSALEMSPLAPVSMPAIGRGLGHGGVFRSQWRGHNLFIKISLRSTLNEARHAMITSAFGLSPKFHGVVTLPDGKIGLVFDEVEGLHLSTHSDLGTDFPFTVAMGQRLRQIGQTLHDLGYQHTKDLQIRVTRSGDVFIVDTEFYSYDVPAQFLTLPKDYRPLEHPRNMADFLAARIEARGRERGAH